jgi:hypothetical protein
MIIFPLSSLQLLYFLHDRLHAALENISNLPSFVATFVINKASLICCHPDRQEMAKKSRLRPGFCALRLSDINNLLSDQKTELINSVANDIAAAFIYIHRQAKAGNLTTTNTEPLENVIGIIRGTDVKYRRHLERKAERYKIAARRQRKQISHQGKELLRIISRTASEVGASKEYIKKMIKKMKQNAEDFHRRLEGKHELPVLVTGKNDGTVESDVQKGGWEWEL